MKTNYIIQIVAMFFFVLNTTAQQGINYKTIINDVNGDALANKVVNIQFTILENGSTNIFQESHNPTTDVNGLIIVNIGEGTLINGDFKAIDWGNSPHFLKTEINTGDGIMDMGTTEFKTVPYALHAETANKAIIDKVDDADADPANEFQNITLVDKTLSLSNGGSVELPSITSNVGQFFYLDKDGDGFGYPFGPVFVPLGLNEPANFVANFDDCNDNDENINPEAFEIRDGKDNNCNGEIDEGNENEE